MAAPAHSLPNSTLIRANISFFGRRLGQSAYTFWNSADFPRLYREYIFQSRSIIRASVP